MIYVGIVYHNNYNINITAVVDFRLVLQDYNII